MPMTAQNWELQNDEKDLGSADVRLASASRYFFFKQRDGFENYVRKMSGHRLPCLSSREYFFLRRFIL